MGCVHGVCAHGLCYAYHFLQQGIPKTTARSHSQPSIALSAALVPEDFWRKSSRCRWQSIVFHFVLREGGQYVSKLSGFSLAKSCKSEEESDVITSEGLLKTGLAFAEEQVKNKLPPAVAASAGTTAIVALLEDGKLTVANIGDSRLVKGSVRGGGGGDGSEETLWVPSWCSEDHKPNDPQEKSRIQASGGATHGRCMRKQTWGDACACTHPCGGRCAAG